MAFGALTQLSLETNGDRFSEFSRKIIRTIDRPSKISANINLISKIHPSVGLSKWMPESHNSHIKIEPFDSMALPCGSWFWLRPLLGLKICWSTFLGFFRLTFAHFMVHGHNLMYDVLCWSSLVVVVNIPLPFSFLLWANLILCFVWFSHIIKKFYCGNWTRCQRDLTPYRRKIEAPPVFLDIYVKDIVNVYTGVCVYVICGRPCGSALLLVRAVYFYWHSVLLVIG